MFKKISAKIKKILFSLKKNPSVKGNKVLESIIDEVASDIESVSIVVDKSIDNIKAEVEKEVSTVVEEVKAAKKPGRPKKDSAATAPAKKAATNKKPAPKKK